MGNSKKLCKKDRHEDQYKAPRGRPPKTRIIKVETKENTNMEYVKKVENLSFEGNIAENWKEFKTEFDIFLIAIEATSKKDETKVGIFLNAIGREARKHLDALNLTEEDKKNYKKVVEAFELFCKGKTNEVYESFVFQNRQQQEGESFDSFLLDIKKLVKSCGYLDENRMLRDRIVAGVKDNTLQKRS